MRTFIKLSNIKQRREGTVLGCGETLTLYGGHEDFTKEVVSKLGAEEGRVK
jgi:hypothetical protein